MSDSAYIPPLQEAANKNTVTLKKDFDRLRDEIQTVDNVLLSTKRGLTGGALPLFVQEADIPEIITNLTLAHRHLEDARMRVGKAIQALIGGVSIYDKPAEEKKEPLDPIDPLHRRLRSLQEIFSRVENEGAEGLTPASMDLVRRANRDVNAVLTIIERY